MNWLKRLFTRKAKPYRADDDRLRICRIFLQVHAGKKVYVITRLAKTKELIEAEFPNAIVRVGVNHHAVGWRDDDPDAYLCCTSTVFRTEVFLQLRARLRKVKHLRQVLIYHPFVYLRKC